MSLLSGKLGRKALTYCNQNPQSYLNRISNSLGEIAHRVSNNYTPGLSRETNILWQYLRSNTVEEVTVRQDGFYVDEARVAGNVLVAAAFIKAGISSIETSDLVGPEELANMPRVKSFAALHYTLASLLPLGIATEVIRHLASSPSITAVVVGAMLLAVTLPTYKLIESLVNFKDRGWPRPRLLETDRLKMMTLRFSSLETNCPAFMLDSYPGRIFLSEDVPMGFMGTSHQEAIFHEKFHALGGSEKETMIATNIFSWKLAFSGRAPAARVLYSLSTAFLHSAFIHLVSLSYLFAKDPYFSFLPPYQLVALREGEKGLIKAKAILEAALKKPLNVFEKQEKTLELAVVCELLGDINRSLKLKRSAISIFYVNINNKKLPFSKRKQMAEATLQILLSIALFFQEKGLTDELEKIAAEAACFKPIADDVDLSLLAGFSKQTAEPVSSLADSRS